MLFSNWAGHYWANPNEVHLSQLMRHTYSHPDEVKLKGLVARNNIINKYSLLNIGQLVMKHFNRINNYLNMKSNNENILNNNDDNFNKMDEL